MTPNPAFQLEELNGHRAEAYAADFVLDTQFLCFEEDPKLEAAVRKEVGKERQYLANFFGPKSDNGDPIRLLYFAIQGTDS